MIRFGAVGTGWRTRFFLRVARARPDLFEAVGVVTRDEQRAEAYARPFGVNLYESLDELLAQKPLFVVTSLPRSVNPGVLTELAARGVPSLSETPPAESVEALTDLYRLVEKGAKMAVAEQYHLQPHHAARIAYAQSGKIGRVTQAQITAAHGYHGVSLIRRTLGIGYENATITAQKPTFRVAQSPDRWGPPEKDAIVETDQVIATLNFGDRFGVYDFPNDYYHSYIRSPRIYIRGERGEIHNDNASYLQDHQTPIHVSFIRHTSGEQSDLDGHYLKGIQVGESWVYRNPLEPAELNDDEIAVGTCMLKMAEYADGGEAFYPLAEACQDRYLDIMIARAAETGQPVVTETQAWAQ